MSTSIGAVWSEATSCVNIECCSRTVMKPLMQREMELSIRPENITLTKMKGRHKQSQLGKRMLTCGVFTPRRGGTPFRPIGLEPLGPGPGSVFPRIYIGDKLD